MKILNFFFLGLLCGPAYAGPMECFEAASKDRVIKWSDDLKAALCRKARSIAPYECFAKVYTNGSDFRISSTLAVSLCQGAVDSEAPAACFNQALEKDPRGITPLQAARLCSGASSAEKVIACFSASRERLSLEPDLAAELCAE